MLGLRCLEQWCLKPAFYDRGVQFSLVKTWGCSSYVQIDFPVALLAPASQQEEEEGEEEPVLGAGGAKDRDRAGLDVTRRQPHNCHIHIHPVDKTSPASAAADSEAGAEMEVPVGSSSSGSRRKLS